jgi:hypothetical protein
VGEKKVEKTETTTATTRRRKTGGRAKGVPNKDKRTLIERLRAEYPGYHPVIAMARIAHDPKSDRATQFAAHKEIARYIEPQRKAVEVTGAPDENGKPTPLIQVYMPGNAR